MGKVGLYLKITVGSFLLLQAFHTVLLEDSTDSPKHTFDPDWLRVKPVESKKTSTEGQTGEDNEVDEAGMGSSDDKDIGMPFGSMSISSGEMDNQDGDANVTSRGMTNITTTILPKPTEALPDSTTHPITLNSTASPDFSNDTVLHETTLAPETTQEPSPGTDVDNRTSNDTEDTANVTTTEVPEINEPSTTASSTMELPSETTVDETTPKSTTTMVPSTTAVDNRKGKGSSSGSNSEKEDLASDYKKNKNNAWGAILGTAVAVAFVGLVVYVILRRRNQRDFSHRKLVEEFIPDPVLRLDNGEPLDLNYGGSGYYNPGLQMDNIQMTNFPRGRNN